MTRKLLLLVAVVLITAANTFAQITDVIALTERRDLTITQIENLANNFFKRVGTGRGTGYKQFQRWLYEAKFHTDANGYLIPEEIEWNNYRTARAAMRTTTGSLRTYGTWTEMGPKSWNRTTGWNPGVGRVTSVAVHPSDTTKIYVSSPGGGIWKSVNSGASWTPLLDNLSSGWMNIFNIAIDPSNQNTIYAAVSGGGVIKSTDAGTTWAATGSGPTSAKKVLVHPTNSNIVFVTGSNGIYRSTNGGSTWTQVHNQSKEDIEFKPGDPNIMYSSGNGNSTTPVSSFWRSADNGLTWTAVSAANGMDAYGRTLIGVSPNDPNVVYVVQASGSIFGKFYKSTDSGLTFTTLITGNAANGTNFFGYNTDGTGTTGQATYDMAICVNPANVNEVHIGGIICFKSINGGSSFFAETAWSLPNSIGYNHADVHALEWVGKTIYSGSDGGVYKSVDYGDNWTDLSSGLGNRQFYRIATSKTNASLFMGGAQDNGTSIYKNTGWIDWLGADGMDCLISPTNESLIWGTSQNGSIYRSTNGGSSYSNLTQPSSGQWVTPLAIESNTNTIYGGWTGVYKSTDNGTTWTNISGTTITTTLACLAVAPSNPQYIYASNGTSLYVTTNGGSSWSTYTTAASVTSIGVSPTNPSKIWITCNSTTNRVFVSTDAGATFTNISGNLPALTARSVAIDDDANETVYVGMNVGVYSIDNTTTSWANLSANLPLVAINEVEIHKVAGKLRVATYGRGVWELDISGSTPPACTTPSNVTVSSITNNSAIINWSAVTGANSYDVQYKTSASGTWITLSGLTATSATLNNLTGSTIYNYQVRTNCTSGSSAYSATQNFTTLADPCGVPTNPASSSVTNNSATISWTAVTGAASYDLQYKTSAATTWTTVSGISTTTYNLTGLSGSTIYNYQVRTNCNASSSGYTSTLNFTTLANPCNTPTNVTAGSITNNAATISWTAVSGAVSYDLQYKTSAASTWTTVSAITSTSYNLTGLSGNTSYNYQVKTNCSANASGYSTSQSFTTSVDPCNTPTNVTAGSITNNTATISWTAVSGAVSYDLQYKTSAATTWTTVSAITTTSYNLTGLSSNTSYNYQVKTNCSANASGYSTSQSFTTSVDPCNTPTNVTTGSITNNTATISWTAVSGAVSYDLQYKTSAATTWTTVSGITTTSYNLTGLSGNTSYNYQVKTNCSANASGYSTTQSFTTSVDPCNTPTSITVGSITNNAATISWTAVSGAVSYDLQYKTSAATTWTTVSGITTTSYNLTGLSGNTSYNYQVKTNCSANASGYSTTQSFTTSVDPCNTPTNVTAGSITNNTATISWTAVSGAVSYDLQYKTSAATTWTTVSAITTTSYNLTGLSGNTSYNYQVKTNCSANASGYSTSQSFTTSVDPCNTPTSITAGSITNNAATISWTAVSGAVSYDLQYKTSAASTWTTITAITATSYNLTGLTGNTIYNYKVKTNCSSNASAYSTAQSFTTLVDPCNTPVNITAGAITDVSASISWTAVSGAVSYDLQYKTAAATTWTTVAGITSTSYNLSGLTASTTYNYQVKTNCSANASGFSTSQSFTTQAGICNSPVNLTASSITTNSATVSWSTVTGAISYTLQYKTAAATTWTSVLGLSSNSYNLTGLTASTTYNFQVKTNCSANASGFSTAASFTTLAPPCSTPGNPNATNVTAASATITWVAVSGATDYDLQYKPSAGTSWTSITGITSTSYNLTGLSSGTVYNYQVKSKCNANTSNFTPAQNFTTVVAACNAPTNVKATGINNSSATLSWDAIAGATDYYIKYKKQKDKNWLTTPVFTLNAYTITGLSSRTSYYAQVWVNCSGGQSYYTQISFKTGAFASVTRSTGDVNGNDTTGTDNTLNATLAPNPASSYVDVIVPYDNMDNSRLIVTDLFGRTLKVINTYNNKTRVDISTLAKGLYYIKIISNNKTETRSFIKQ